MAERMVYASGDLIPESQAGVNLYDSAIIVGEMVYEATRTFRQEPFRLPAHLRRLYASLKFVDIDCRLTIEEMEHATLETVAANLPAFPDGDDFIIWHNISRGAAGPFFADAFPRGIRPTIFISCFPVAPYLATIAEGYRTGVHAIVPRQRSIPARLLDPKVKTRSRLHYRTADLEVRAIDARAWALLTDEDGFITEGTVSNFMIVSDGAIVSPEPRNMLRGITREVIKELAADLGLGFVERNLDTYDVVASDEAFFCSSPFAIMPVSRFNGRPIADGRPGVVTLRLLDAFSESVGIDIAAQGLATVETSE